MATIRQYLKNLKEFRSTILDTQEETVIKKEPEIIKLNLQNIENHIGFDGNNLINTNKKFDGVYSLATELFAQQSNSITQKKAGEHYNFIWSGDFVNNFKVDIDSSLTKVRIYSTGDGGEKTDFFKGYKNLYGLTKDKQLWLNNEIILALRAKAKQFI
jgi:hypothetical protein